jgi:hypothetical protein
MCIPAGDSQSLRPLLRYGHEIEARPNQVSRRYHTVTASHEHKENTMMQETMTQETTTDIEIRPFGVDIPEAALVELRRRVAATQWPEKETVADTSQGVQLAPIQELARYWATEYDWRKVEAKLKALPQFITAIDGLDIHFIHVRSKHEDALPLIVNHGWPGSIIEQLKIIEPLTEPTAHGGNAADAFHVVIPSMPGYGFSGKPTSTGWGPERMGRAWDVLMQRLGYTRYGAQGVAIPVAVSVFPGEQYEAPRSWAERAYSKLIYYNRVEKGGHSDVHPIEDDAKGATDEPSHKRMAGVLQEG